MGKHLQDSFPKEKSRHASKPLELIYNDIFGPTASYSLGEAKYFLTLLMIILCFYGYAPLNPRMWYLENFGSSNSI
jgi:hypothetical protein